MKRVCNYIIDRWSEYDDKKHIFTDVLNYGCQSGVVGELIYYTDTVRFYKQYKEEINSLLYDAMDGTGLYAPSELFGDKWDKEDPLAQYDYNQNLLAWFGSVTTLKNSKITFKEKKTMKTTITKKEKAIEIMKKMDIYKPYIKGFEERDQVCFFEMFGGFWIDQEPELHEKMKAIEKEHKCKVYAVTHEYTEFGELYDFLIVTDYPEEWDTLVYSQGNRHTAFAYVWNKDDDWCSEFGSVTVQSFGGGIKRIA